MTLHLHGTGIVNVELQDYQLIINDTIIQYRYIYGVRRRGPLLLVYYCDPIANTLGSRDWVQKQLELTENEETETFLDSFGENLHKTVFRRNETHAETVPIHVILNPVSGIQKTHHLWTTIVQPMLEAAGFAKFNIFTTVAKDNAAMIRTKVAPLIRHKPCYVVILGGDGTVHDVVNGLNDEANPIKTVLLSVVPTGSGNALALSLKIESVEDAVLRLLHGDPQPLGLMDVSFGKVRSQGDDWQDHVEFTSEKMSLGVVMSWGFHCQVVSKSRWLRYVMGPNRFNFVGGILLWLLAQYQGQIVLKNAKRYERDEDAFHDVDGPVTLTGPFTYFLACKQSSLDRGFRIAPHASPFSDDFDIVVMQNATSDQVKHAMVQAFNNGEHIKDPAVEYYKASDLLLRMKHGGEVCLDGEIRSLPANGCIRLAMQRSDTGTTFGLLNWVP